MSKITKQNVGGTNYTMVGCTLTGVCASAASDFIKAVTLSDGDEASDGMTIVVTFANGNTAGTAPQSKTIYSSDQVNYYEDDQLTVPFTLAPEGCYEIEYTGEGNAYSYISYPIMQVGSVSGPICDASGNKASGALWLAGDKVSVNYSNGCFNVIPQVTDSMTVMTASSVVNGAPLRAGSTVRVMFTADLAGTDTATGLVLSYNGVNTPVKVGKNGSLSNFVASEVSTGVYKYVQAYTTLELAFDGTQFIIIGNPVVLSSSDYTIYADGKGIVDSVTNNDKRAVTSNAVYKKCARYVNYAKGNIWTTSKSSFTTTKDCYLDYNVCATTPADRNIYIDNKKVGVQDNENNMYTYTFHGFVKSGSTIRRGDNISLIGGTYLQLFELS